MPVLSVLPVGRSDIGNPKHIFLEHRHKLDFSPKDLLSFPRHRVLRTQAPSVSTHQLTLEGGSLGKGCRLWGPLHMCLHVSLTLLRWEPSDTLLLCMPLCVHVSVCVHLHKYRQAPQRHLTGGGLSTFHSTSHPPPPSWPPQDDRHLHGLLA